MSFIYNAHAATQNVYSLFLQVYAAQDIKSRFPRIENIFNSIIFPSDNLPCSFPDRVKIVNGRHTANTLNMLTKVKICSIYGHTV